MPSEKPDDLPLLIRCPSCSQRFKVGEDLREKTVECGACEARFRINDEVIVRSRKIYPGERKSPALHRFQRVPLSISQSTAGQQAMRYGTAPDPALLEPASPLRILAGAAGVAGMVLMAMMLMFGASRGGILDGITFDKRMLMAGFAGILGVGLLVYANPKARLKAAGVGLLLSAGVLAIPFTFTTGSVPIETREDFIPSVAISAESAEPSEDDEIVALRNKIGTDPLEREINRLANEGSTKTAVGLWLRGLSDMNRILIRDYIFRTTGADPSSANYYPRGNGDFLMVITGARQTLTELAEVASLLGNVEKVYPEISVIEVRVNNENFTEGPIEKLSKKEDPAFYDLNKRELESIDLDRVKRAVQRLAEAEPKIYRTDITRRLISMLGDDGYDFKGNICRALMTWSEVDGPASDAAVATAKQLMDESAEVPAEVMALIVKERNPDGIPLLDELWAASPNNWELLYADYGPVIEPSLLKRFPDTEGIQRYSVVRLLGRIGGSDSLPVLAAAANGANPEMRVLLEQAQKAIHERLAQ